MIKEHVQDKKCVLRFFLCSYLQKILQEYIIRKQEERLFECPVETEILLMQWASRRKL